MNNTATLVLLSVALSVPVVAEAPEPVKNVIIQHELDLAGVEFILDVLGQTARAARAQEFPMTANDLRLAPTAPVIDKGAVLPNVNDGWSGAAPDIGCYELGEALPHYGPRPRP